MPTLPNTTRKIVFATLSFALVTSIWTTNRVRAQEMTDTPVAPTMAPKVTPFKPLSTEKPSIEPEKLTFIITPPRVELAGKPGETLQTTLKIKNVSNKAQTFRSEAFDFIVAEDGKTPMQVSEKVSGRWSASTWMTVSPTSINIPANGNEEITVLIQIPGDALAGGHYAMVLHTPVASSKAVKKSGDAASGIDARAGSLFYLTVAGDIHEEAFIRNFKAPTWVEFGPVDFSYSVENQSDIHITPQATVTVRDIFGRVMTKERVSAENIFPYLSRDFQATWDIFWGIGPYTATVEASYGSQGKIARAVTQFWIIPYRVLLAVIVAGASLTAVLIAIRRHLHHRNGLQSQQIEILEERIRELEGRNTERGRQK